MHIKEFSKDLSHRSGISVYVQITNVLLVVVIVFMSFALANANRTHRVTMVPPGITKTFWVEDEIASPEYLEQMGLFLLQLALNRHPLNAQSQIATLLKYVAPSSYGELKQQLDVEVKRQIESNISTIFHPTNVAVGQEKKILLVDGVLTTWIGEKKIKEEHRKYLINFDYSGGRMYIKAIKDVTGEKDPANA
jgi:conjugal transfer pilus assembly protein TraE